MRPRIRPLIVATLCLAALLSACKREEPPPSELPPIADYMGDLGALVHGRSTLTVALNLQAIRDDAILSEFWTNASLIDGDPLSVALAEGEQMLVVWSDPMLARRIHIVRGDVDQARLVNVLDSSDNVSGAPLRTSFVGRHSLWFVPDSSWAVASPTPNLLMTGDLELVQAGIVLSEELAGASPPAAASSTGAPLLEVSGELTSLHRQLIRSQVGSDPALEPARALRSVRLTIQRTEGYLCDLRLEFVSGTDPEAIRALAVALIASSFDDPDFARRMIGNLELDADIEEGVPRLVATVAIPPDALVEALSQAFPDGVPQLDTTSSTELR